MAVLQREQQFSIEGADGAGVAVREVDAAVGNAQVVEDGLELVGRHQLADGDFHPVGQARGFLDAGAGGGAHMQADLPRIHGREEVAAQHRVQQARQQTEAEEEADETAALRKHHR